MLMRNFKIHDLQPEGYPKKEEHTAPAIYMWSDSLFHVNIPV